MDRGVRVDRTYQLNFGGNTDFLNMLERERLESKKISKTKRRDLDARLRHRPRQHPRRPVGHVPWLLDRKYCYIVMEGTTFGDVPAQVRDEARGLGRPQTAAGVVIDALRCLKLGLVAVSRARSWRPGVLQEEPADPAPRRHRLHPGEAFIPREDNQTLVGTETLPRELSPRPAPLRAARRSRRK